jgi:hypothetical protein
VTILQKICLEGYTIGQSNAIHTAVVYKTTTGTAINIAQTKKSLCLPLPEILYWKHFGGL